jgi:hypothetical protein
VYPAVFSKEICMKRSFSIVALLAAFLCGTASATVAEDYPGFYVGMEPPAATVIDPTIADGNTETYESILATLMSIDAGIGNDCSPLTLAQWKLFLFSKPSWVSTECYNRYLGTFYALYYDYASVIEQHCHLYTPTEHWDCSCLRQYRTVYISKIAIETLWMLNNCAGNEPI